MLNLAWMTTTMLLACWTFEALVIARSYKSMLRIEGHARAE